MLPSHAARTPVRKTLRQARRARHLAELASTAVYFRVLFVPLVPQTTVVTYQQRRFRATPLSLMK